MALFFDSLLKLYTNRKIQKNDLGFEISQGALPVTEATAFVDAGYSDNTAPYFADINQAISWVNSRGGGRIVVSSNYDSITLLEGVSLFLMPNVTIQGVTIENINGLSIEGSGTIDKLTVAGADGISVKNNNINTLDLQYCSNTLIDVNNISLLTLYASTAAKIFCKKSINTASIGYESTCDLFGCAEIGDLTVVSNTSLNLIDSRVMGKTDNSSRLQARCCEFKNTSGVPTIISNGPLLLENCWVYSTQSNCIAMNTAQSNPSASLILDDTKLYCLDTAQYSVTANQRTPNLQVFIYGNSVARTNMDSFCTSNTNTLVVDSALQYKYF